MKRIDEIVKKLLKLDKTISAGAVGRILNGTQSLRIDISV